MKGTLWLVRVVLVRVMLVGVRDTRENRFWNTYGPVLNWSGPVLVFNGI